MKRVFKVWIVAFGALMMLSTLSSAAMTTGDALFERVTMVNGHDAYFHEFEVTQAGDFTLTLTDFAFPDQLDALGVTLVSATEAIASIVIEREPTAPMGVFAGSSHSWGSGFWQESVSGTIAAGTYYLSMYAEFDPEWHAFEGMQYGLYGVEMIATPVPASLIFMLSGLAAFRFVARKRS